MERRILLGALMAVVTSASVVTAQPPAEKPAAEQKALERFVGTWKLEGTMEASPMGPGGKFSGTERCRMFEGGWHLVCDTTGTGPMGNMTGHMILTYDRAAKQYRYFAVNNMADAEMAMGTLSGNTWTWTSTMDMGGQKIHSRFVLVEDTPTKHSLKWDMSMDGKNYKTMMNATATKEAK